MTSAPVRVVGTAVATLALTVAQLSASVTSWQKKDWTEWSEQDCSNVLLHSPWAFQAATTWQEPRYEIHRAYSIKFISALPVRLALVRQEQLKAKYDKMASEQRKEFDQLTARELDAGQYGDIVALDVYYSEYQDGPNSHRENPPAPQQCTLMMPNGHSIASSSPKLIKSDDTSVEYSTTFPRTVNGVPLPSITGKKVQLACPIADQLDTSKMVFNGKLEY